MPTCIISMDSWANLFTEAGTVAGNFQKIGQFTFPTRVMVLGAEIKKTAAVGFNLQYLIVDSQTPVGSLLAPPVTDVCIGHAAIKFYFPPYHGMKVETTQSLGVYSYSAANGTTFSAVFQVHTRPI